MDGIGLAEDLDIALHILCDRVVEEVPRLSLRGLHGGDNSLRQTRELSGKHRAVLYNLDRGIDGAAGGVAGFRTPASSVDVPVAAVWVQVLLAVLLGGVGAGVLARRRRTAPRPSV